MSGMNRVALVTGASRGLGRGTALALAKLGYTVVGTARTLAAAQAMAAEALASGLTIVPEQVDIGSDEQVDALFERLRARFDRLDVLVNNAGIIGGGYAGNALTTPANVIAEAFDINTLGAYRMSQRALPLMNAAGYGRIVNVTSGMGLLHDQDDGAVAYRISKTALSCVTIQFHHAAGGPNVKVNAVCPGWVRTDMGGPSATRSVEEGIVGIVWAATLDESGPSGGVFRDGKPVPW
jgi:NAD(P)-dependent dehydrogenase (short-subunit alcohol dehydrogenase family)